MSNSDPSLDELVSAYIDGEATAEEIARVESDPELMARAHIFRSIDSIVAEPVTPPVTADAARESAIAAALAASNTTPKVTSLAPKQSKPSIFARPNAALMGAAAVLFVLLAGFAVLNSTTGGDDVASDSFEEVGVASSDDAGDGGDAGAEAVDLSATDAGEAMEMQDADAAQSAPSDGEDDAMEEEAMEDDAMDDSEPAAEVADEVTDDDAGEPESDDDGDSAYRATNPAFATIAEIEAAYPPEVVNERLSQQPAEALSFKSDQLDSGLQECNDAAFVARVVSLTLVDIVDLVPNGEVEQTIYVFVDPNTETPSDLVLVDLAACAQVTS